LGQELRDFGVKRIRKKQPWYEKIVWPSIFMNSMLSFSFLVLVRELFFKGPMLNVGCWFNLNFVGLLRMSLWQLWLVYILNIIIFIITSM
jgi:hypothetical protein